MTQKGAPRVSWQADAVASQADAVASQADAVDEHHPAQLPAGHVIVRDARPGEGRRFEEIRVAGWHAAYADLLHPDVLRACVLDEKRVAWRERWLAAPPAGEVTLVAEVDGEVAAGAFLWPSRDADLDDTVAELASLYVQPDLRRSGLGAALLEEGFRRMPQLVEVLWTFEGNAPARRFYEKHGFLADGARRVLRMVGDPVEVRYRRLSPGSR